MIGELSNHLWQSTIFVICAALLAAALRKNGAHIRHLVWVTASLKFLVPFSLLMTLGGQFAWTRPVASSGEVPVLETVSIVVDQVAQPFTADESVMIAPPAPAVDWVPIVLVGVWVIGFAAILLMRLRGWVRVRAAVRKSAPVTIDGVGLAAGVNIRASAGLLEPGIVGLWRPILLVPAGIENRLTPLQLEAVLAHEQCHIRRRDNVTAAIHMIVEAMFWFHPLVWWIGARMVDERERACDEYVLRALGKPEAYAEGILNICKLYAESPLTCVSGVTGSNLKKRIEAIMVNRIGMRLNFARKTAIALAATLALVVPIVVGVITSPIRTAAQSQAQNGPERFDVVSVKPCNAPGPSAPGTPPTAAGARGGGSSMPWQAQVSPGRVYWDCVTLRTLVDQAFADTNHRLLHMVGDSQPPHPGPRPAMPPRVRRGPAWADKDMFTIEVTAPGALTAAALGGSVRRNLGALPEDLAHALRAVLEERFQLKAHRETEEQEMFGLRISPKGLNSQTVKPTTRSDCVTSADYFATDPADRAGLKICGRYFSTLESWAFTGSQFSQLAGALIEPLGRYVLDETGNSSIYNFTAVFGRGDGTETFETRAIRALDALGLKLQSTKGKAEYIVIDQAERPAPNDAAPTGRSKFALPFLASVPTAPMQTAAQSANGPERFEVISIKPCQAPNQAAPGTPPAGGGRGAGTAPWHAQTSPGRVYWDCVTLTTLVDQAYADTEHPLLNMVGDSRPPRNDGLGPNQPKRVRGGPPWADKDMFTIEVTAPNDLTTLALAGAVRRNLVTFPPVLSHALRAALEDRFKVSVRRVMEQQDMYALKIGDNGLDKTRVAVPVPGDCVAREQYSERRAAAFAAAQPKTIAEMEALDPRICGGLLSTMTGMEFTSATFSQLAVDLSRTMDRYVLDQTGVDAKFNFKLRAGDGETPDQRRASSVAQLGLKLQTVKAPAEHLFIDRAERPTPDSPAPSGSSRFVWPLLAMQSPATASPSPQKFEVASIKPCDPSGDNSTGRGGGNGPNFASSPGRITVNCVNAAYLILRAYVMNGTQKADDPINAWANEAGLYDPQHPEQRRIRGPAWIYADKFSIEASAPGGADDKALWGAMLRALLEDRFQLKLHRATEEAPMFALTVGKDGPKFSRGECIPFEWGKTNVAAARKENPGKVLCATLIGDAPQPAMSFQIGGPISELVRVLRQAIKSPVIDQTGLTGIFNISFQYEPDAVHGAVQDQLGLKLTPMKGPRGFLVLDRIERPAPDAPATQPGLLASRSSSHR